MVAYVTFLRDVACHKLLNSANVSRSYSQNNSGTVFLNTVYIPSEHSVNFRLRSTQTPHNTQLRSPLPWLYSGSVFRCKRRE